MLYEELQKYDKVMLDTAELWAQQSKCIVNKVGAVIAKDSRIISIGYNGTPSGYEEYDEEICKCCGGKGETRSIHRMITCYCCNGSGIIQVPKKLDCEKEKEKLISKCCKADIIKDLKNNKIYCSKCNNEIGVIDPANDNSGNYRLLGDFETKKELITDHSKVIHAEANAILFAAKEGIPLKNTTIYVTTSPCAECSKMIIQSGIKRVVFKELYRNTNGLDLLISCGVKVQQYIIEDNKERLKNYSLE